MSVNARKDYQFITQHSEGDDITNIQLAAFYCCENTSDGGETILMKTDVSSSAWENMRGRDTRLAPGTRPLRPAEAARAKALYKLRSSNEITRSSDIVIEEWPSNIADLRLVTVVGKLAKCRSVILKKDVPVYWDAIGCVDHTALDSFSEVIKERNLLRVPAGGMDIRDMDQDYRRRIWNSGISYSELFRCSIVHNLQKGEMIIQNNLTWTHGVANWSPRSGSRRVLAAFA